MYISSNPNRNPYPYILIPYPNNHNTTLKWKKFFSRDNHCPPTNPIFGLFPAWGSRGVDPLAQKAVKKESRMLTGTVVSKVREVQFESLGKLYGKNFLHVVLLHNGNNSVVMKAQF